MVASLFADRRPVALTRGHVAAQIGGPADAGVLSGRPGADRPDPGPVLCACLDVGVNTIVRAIESGACLSVAAITAALGAGGNCGSCRPEIQSLIDARQPPRLAAE